MPWASGVVADFGQRDRCWTDPIEPFGQPFLMVAIKS